MLRYTARNGTTFQFDPNCAESVHIYADDPTETITLDVEDLREFLQHLDDRSELLGDMPMDADLTSVGPD
ncbi:MAG: hypothetical protein ABIP55_16355 [Tepidisphaeraceae bacterium]